MRGLADAGGRCVNIIQELVWVASAIGTKQKPCTILDYSKRVLTCPFLFH